MFLIRQALSRDIDDLHALARQTYFINLPPDRDIIAAKIEQSRRSFLSLARPGRAQRSSTGAAGKARAPRPAHTTTPRHHHDAASSGIRAVTGHSDLFMLALEDTTTGGVIGTSQVIAEMGGTGRPRIFLQLSNVTRESRSLKISWTHQMARIGRDETGPAEIGGLILNHAFRGHPQRLGRLLSFARFHIIGLWRDHFPRRIVAEMLGAIDKNGHNPFFEKFTRHYVPRPFPEVYRFSQTSKEFVEGLIPHWDIDLSILDPEVAHAAGAVGEDTRPARRMLENLGFEYRDQIDPLDGGPHLEARISDIPLVETTRKVKEFAAMRSPSPAKRAKSGRAGRASVPEPTMIASTLDADGNFRALASIAPLSRGTTGPVKLIRNEHEALEADHAIVRGVTILR